MTPIRAAPTVVTIHSPPEHMHLIIDYLNGVAKAHQVDPLWFILIYVITTGPFLFVSAWLFHHIRKERPLAVLAFFWALLYSAPYIYILAVGRDLPIWAYVLVAMLVAGGLALSVRGLMRRLARDRERERERR